REAERVSQTGAVGSLQEAEVTLPGSVLERIWSPPYLERLGRAYWRHLSRATLGLIRVAYGEDSRTVVLLSRRLALLRFHAPEYEAYADHGCVTWRIERGLLVAAEGRDNGFLRICVERRPDPERSGGEQRLRVRLEVRNFYPWLRGSGRFARLGAWLYGQTQLRIHVLVGNAFLRSLARLDLPPSRVGALAGEIEATTNERSW
ncbi:MAG: hypothetical protein ACRDLO_11120, partial [Solirubrobacterales bacterium]